MNDAAPANPHRYQRWTDRPVRRRWAWPAIMATGVRLANKGTRTRGLIWTSLGFAAGSCGFFYALAQLEILAGTRQAEGLYEFVRMTLGVDLGGASHLGEYREVLWRAAFLFLFKAEMFWAFVIIAFVGPSLIADDLKTNALPIYFSRPITPMTYLFGKWLVLAVYTGLAVLVSNLLGLLFGVLVTGGLATFSQTARLASDLLWCGLGTMIFAGVLMLTLSSMCRDKRYVTVGWVAIFVLPMVVQGILNDALPRSATAGWLGSISLYNDLSCLAEWKLGLRQALEATSLPREAFTHALGRAINPAYPAFVLSIITVVAGRLCHRQVIRFSRSAANV